MAAFPSLVPSSRVYTPGTFSNTPHLSIRGNERRVLHGSLVYGGRLKLIFDYLSTDDANLIATHYVNQRGGFLAFLLPSELLQGVATPSSLTPSSFAWRYVGTVSIDDVSINTISGPVNCHNVSIELEMTQPEAVTLLGLAYSIAATVTTAGAVSVVYVTGSALGVTTTLTAGDYSIAASVPELTLSVVASLAVSGAMSILVAPGADLTISITISPGLAVDPYFSDVRALLHMNGANNSTTFTDSSPLANTYTASGVTKISTAQSKFSGSSGFITTNQFDSGNLTLPGATAATAFNFGTADFTLETWCFHFPSTISNYLWSFVGGVYPGSGGIALYVTSSNLLTLAANSSQISGNLAQSTSTVPTNQWAHVAVTRQSGVFKLWINGVQDGSDSSHTTYNASSTGGSAASIGTYFGNTRWWGYLAEFRITKNVARYTSTFTPPTTSFPNS